MSDPVGMSFKAKMNNLAKKLGLRPQTVIQNFMFERFLARLAQSPFRENFVVKGGVLISAMIGIEARSTMDMDATVIDLPMTQRSIRHAVAGASCGRLSQDSWMPGRVLRMPSAARYARRRPSRWRTSATSVHRLGRSRRT